MTYLEALLQLSYTPETPDAISLLPPNLTRLAGLISVKVQDAFAIAQSDWSRAPPSLTSIGSIQGPYDYSWLPRNLIYDHLDSRDFSQEDFLSLPPNVLSVDLWSFRRTNELLVPKGTQSLSIGSLRYEHALGRNIVQLPPALTRLKGESQRSYYINWDDIRALWEESGNKTVLWPPITYMRSSWDGMAVTDLKLLPQTLTHLQLSLDFAEDADDALLDFELFPPTPTTLKVRLPTRPCSYKFQNISPHIRKLHIFSLAISEIERQTFESLPDTITSLQLLSFAIKETNVENSRPWKLPKSLTSLALLQWPRGWFFALSRSLTSLHLEQVTGFNLNSSVVAKGDGLIDLPLGLLYLEISAYTFRDNEVPELPPQRLSHFYQLETLIIANLGRFSSSMIRELPSSLRTVKIELLNGINPTDAPYTPSRLKFFRFGAGITVSSEVASYLPLAAETPGVRDSEEMSRILNARLDLLR